MSVTELLPRYDQLRSEVQAQEVECYFMLVDLAGSTLFKTQNAEIEWLVRLYKFYEVVRGVAAGKGNLKFLGDGSLLTLKKTESPDPHEMTGFARGVLQRVQQANAQMPKDHTMVVRIVLGFGRAYIFNDNDPQGTAVDKLFRMEKLVPDGAIGVTDEYATQAGITEPPVGWFPLKGLPDPELHPLRLIEPRPPIALLSKLKARSQAAALWLPISGSHRVHLVSGTIPEGEVVQVGDFNAKLHAYENLVSLGCDAARIRICDSSELQEAEYADDIVSIRGPYYNHATRRLLDGLPVHFLELDNPDNDSTPLRDDVYDETLLATQDGDRFTNDWGLFIHRRNPEDPSRRTLVACGIESAAVDGILRAFSLSNPDFHSIMDAVQSLSSSDDRTSIPDFYCIMPFQISHGKAMLPTGSDQLLRIRLL